jgi:hypothetical protein
MTRRWLQSADVEVDEATGAILVHGDFDQSDAPPRSMAGGTKNVAAVNVAEPLITVATPCRCVWIGPPCSADGIGTNTKPVFLGDSGNQNMPLLPSSISGVVLSIDDASKVYVKVGTAGEGVVFRIFA